MPTQWYYAIDGHQHGPVAPEELRRLVIIGQLHPTDLVWRPGLSAWVAARNIRGLFPELEPHAAGDPLTGHGAAHSHADLPPAPPRHAPASTPRVPSAPAAAHAAVAETPAPSPRRAQAVGYASPPSYHPTHYVGAYAAFWQRILATLLDGALLYGAEYWSAQGLLYAIQNGYVPATLVTVALYWAAWVIINWLYYAGCESSAARATLGKYILRIRVVDGGGNRIGFARATGRYFGKLVSTLTIGIGFLMPLWTSRKQALHDIMANTLVIKRHR